MKKIISFFKSPDKECNAKKEEVLAEACKNGDAAAMYEKAYVMRNRCTPEENLLLKQYEEEPSEEHKEKICIRKNLSLWVNAYMMWLVRAAIYGCEAAAELLEKCPIYKRLAYIPYYILTEDDKGCITFGSSDILHIIGFTDVPKGYDDCRLLYDTEKRIYDLCYVSSYEEPDEYGFGAKWDFADIYFDEFFHRLSKKLNSDTEIMYQSVLTILNNW